MVAITHLATLMALATSTVAIPYKAFHLRAAVYRWTSDECTGHFIDPKHENVAKELKSNTCKTFKEEFNSFMYMPYKKDDGGYRDTAECKVTAFKGAECTGESYSPGSFLTTYGQCASLPGAKSVQVFCEDLSDHHHHRHH